MKILICTPEYPPYTHGIGNVVYNITENFKNLGVDFKICSPVGPDIKIGNHKIMEKTGILGLTYFSNLVLKYFKNNKFDLGWFNGNYFANNPFENAFVTLHSTYLGFYKNGVNPQLYHKLASKLERFYLNKINTGNVRFSGVSREVCKELELIGISHDDINYIPNGVDINIFKPSNAKYALKDKFGIPKENLVILSIGRLSEPKRPKKIIETFSLIEKSIEKVSLIIAGDGDLLKETKELAIKEKLNNVLFLGKVNYNKVKDLYAVADYFLMTSKYEGQPLTLLEAISSGLPCIVSDIPSLDIVKEAKCGIIVNFDDSDSINKIPDYILKNNSNHSKNARKYAVDNLDWKNVAQNYINQFYKIYENQ